MKLKGHQADLFMSLIVLWEVCVYDSGTLGADDLLSLSRWEECEESTRGVKGILLSTGILLLSEIPSLLAYSIL